MSKTQRRMITSSPWLWLVLLTVPIGLEFAYAMRQSLGVSVEEAIDAGLTEYTKWIYFHVPFYFVTPFLLLLCLECLLVDYRENRLFDSASKKSILWGAITVGGVLSLQSLAYSLRPAAALEPTWTGMTLLLIDTMALITLVAVDLIARKTLVASIWGAIFFVQFKMLVAAALFANGAVEWKLLIFLLCYVCLGALLLGAVASYSALKRSSETRVAKSQIKTLRFKYLVAALSAAASIVGIVLLLTIAIVRLQIYPPLESRLIYYALCIGSAWSVSMPMIVLFLLLFQQVRHQRVVDSQPHYQLLFDHLSIVTSTAVTIMRKHGFRTVVGGSINVALSHLLLLEYLPEGTLQGLISGPTLDTGLSFVIYANAWFASVVTWTSPFFENLIRYRETRREALGFRIHREVSDAHDHFVIAGYGDMGRRVVDLMQQDSVILPPMIKETREAFLTDGERVELLSKVLIVDKDSSMFEFVVSSGAIDIGLVPLNASPATKLKRMGFKSQAPRFAVGICGDVNDRQVLDAMRLDRSLHYACLARDTRAAFSSTDHLFSTDPLRKRLSIIAVPTSATLEYFSSNPVHACVSHIYLEHLRSLAVAEVVASFRRAQTEGVCKVLLVGSGKELAYIIDSLWRSLTFERVRDGQVFGVHLVTDDCYYLDRFSTDLERRNKRGSSDVRWREVNFHLLYYGVADRDGQVRLHVTKTELRVPGEINKIFDDLKPDLVVVAEPDNVRQLVTLRSVIDAARMQSAAEKRIPRLVVAAETGQPGRAKNLADAGLFYSFFFAHEAGGVPLGQYPGTYVARTSSWDRGVGDSNVDVLEYPSHRIVGMMRSHVLARTEEGSRPVEGFLCLHNRPGALPLLFSRLAGYERPSAADDDKWRVTFEGTSTLFGRWNTKGRAKASRGEGNLVDGEEFNSTFVIKTRALLVGKKWEIQVDPIQRSLLLPLPIESGDSTLDGLKESLGLRKGGDPTDEGLCKDCPKMLSCQIAVFRMHAQAAQHGNRGDFGQYLYERARASPKAMKRGRPPAARFFALCSDGDRPGALASFFSAVSFQRIGDRRPVPKAILNVSHYIDYPCHNRAFTIASVYCNEGKERHRGSQKGEDMIPFRALMIRVTSQPRDWLGYCERLVRFLRRVRKETWKLDIIDSKEPHMFVVHCMEKSPLELYRLWYVEKNRRREKPGLPDESQAFRAFMREVETSVEGTNLLASPEENGVRRWQYTQWEMLPKPGLALGSGGE